MTIRKHGIVVAELVARFFSGTSGTTVSVFGICFLQHWRLLKRDERKALPMPRLKKIDKALMLACEEGDLESTNLQ